MARVAGRNRTRCIAPQFARTPYAVSFKAADTTFILVTLHVTFGNPATERVPELKGIARWMREWANQANAWSQNLIALGDFNIDRQADPLWQAFVSTGLGMKALGMVGQVRVPLCHQESLPWRFDKWNERQYAVQ